MRRTLGTLEPVEYFVNYRDPAHPPGYTLLAPYTGCRPPEGYQSEHAGTLADVDRLQRTLQEQERRQWEREAEANEQLVAEKSAAVRDSLYARMVSGATSAYEREFIRCYLQLRDERRAKYRQRFLEYTCYLTAREMDTPRNRSVSEESVSLDRLVVKP